MNDVQTDAWGGKKIRAAIIEDELPAARLLQGMLAELRPQWDILLLPGTIEEAVQWFATHPHPDILFLDIQLTDGLSFYFIEQARPESMIVFTTAYDEYAVRAFTVNSIDYLLKPVRRERLADSLEKFERLTTPRIREQNERMDMQELLRMLADRRTHIIDLPLTKLEEQLDPRRFFRVSRQFILSADCICDIEPYFNGKMVVHVTPPFDGSVQVSRERVAALKVWLNS